MPSVSDAGQRCALGLAVLWAGCQTTHEVDAPYKRPDAGVEDAGHDSGDPGPIDDDRDAAPEDGGRDASSNSDDDAGSEPDTSCEAQIEDALDGLPDSLSCTGLYSDIRRKIVGPGVRQFAPAVPLWSDGSGKQRWIMLPEGKQIDASQPNDWVFPVGTKLFKEFRVNGRRIETRIFQKTRDDRWARAAYEWDVDETEATRSLGGDRADVILNDSVYHVPTGRECDQCHGGRKDRILGFEAVSLGLDGAQGLTLAQLASEDLLDPPPRSTHLQIGDDGTGLAAPVLGYLHINCGVCCHNANQNADAYSSGLWMKLNVNHLDGRPVDGFDAIEMAVEQPMKSDRWGADRKRIVPGDPLDSVLLQLVRTRIGEPKEQMPPIASSVVDTVSVKAIADWITVLPD
jgi:hypothetical protein